MYTRISSIRMLCGHMHVYVRKYASSVFILIRFSVWSIVGQTKDFSRMKIKCVLPGIACEYSFSEMFCCIVEKNGISSSIWHKSSVEIKRTSHLACSWKIWGKSHCTVERCDLLIVKTLKNVFWPWKSLLQGKCVLFGLKSVAHAWELQVILFYILA